MDKVLKMFFFRWYCALSSVSGMLMFTCLVTLLLVLSPEESCSCSGTLATAQCSLLCWQVSHELYWRKYSVVFIPLPLPLDLSFPLPPPQVKMRWSLRLFLMMWLLLRHSLYWGPSLAIRLCLRLVCWYNILEFNFTWVSCNNHVVKISQCTVHVRTEGFLWSSRELFVDVPIVYWYVYYFKLFFSVAQRESCDEVASGWVCPWILFVRGRRLQWQWLWLPCGSCQPRPQWPSCPPTSHLLWWGAHYEKLPSYCSWCPSQWTQGGWKGREENTLLYMCVGTL